MNKKSLTRGLVGLAAAAALVVVPAISASAALVPTVGSAHPVYLASIDDGSVLPDGASNPYKWNLNVLATPNGEDPTGTSKFGIPADADSVVKFIAPRGKENDQSQWNAYAALGWTPGGIQTPNLQPSSLTSTGQGSPSGIRSVFTASGSYTGGEYSIGIAFLKNSGLTIVETDFLYIDVIADTNFSNGKFTFLQPAAPAVAPVITTTSLNPLTTGTTFTQTLAATGTAPITWSLKSGTLPAGLALDGAAGTISGTPTATGAYSFTLTATNSAGSVDQAFTGTVAAPAPTAPTEPTTGAITITDPAKGATSITVPAGAANKGKTFDVWAWSTPTKLGQVTADATTGDVVVDITTLPAGAHKVALVLPGDATFAVQEWVSFTKTANDDEPKDIDLTAKVVASDLWQLKAEKTAIDFGSVARDQVSPKQSLGVVTVVDDRTVLKGWTLDASWTSFTNAANDEIPASALTITPRNAGGYTPPAGISIGTAPRIAESTAISTLPSGALFDADLTFKAPKDAKTGDYKSKLTLTLTSK